MIGSLMHTFMGKTKILVIELYLFDLVGHTGLEKEYIVFCWFMGQQSTLYCMGSIAKCCMSAHWVGFPLNAKSFARPNSNHFCPTSLMLSLWRLFMYGEKSEK
ncbi:hypothetical protein CsSME_00021601 [Camellia sinensis var. sinensis]